MDIHLIKYEGPECSCSETIFKLKFPVNMTIDPVIPKQF